MATKKPLLLISIATPLLIGVINNAYASYLHCPKRVTCKNFICNYHDPEEWQPMAPPNDGKYVFNEARVNPVNGGNQATCYYSVPNLGPQYELRSIHWVVPLFSSPYWEPHVGLFICRSSFYQSPSRCPLQIVVTVGDYYK